MIRALLLYVFGTLGDWRSSIAREAKVVLGPLGQELDWHAFAEAWRAEYQPSMEEVRSGRRGFIRCSTRCIARTSIASCRASSSMASPRRRACR